MYMEAYSNAPLLFFLNKYIVLLNTFLCATLLFASLSGIKYTKKRIFISLCAILISSCIFQLLGGCLVFFVKLV